MWCRVARAQADRRLLATMWPLYILQSHLPLNMNVLIHTETGLSYMDLADPDIFVKPIRQPADGCGVTTQLMVPGTTAARHSMTFQYKNSDTSITCKPIPLHYSVTETTVFERQPPVVDIDDVLNEIRQWLHKYGKKARPSWPYSIVTSHFDEAWLSPSGQPKSDILVNYQPVRGGGGCCVDVKVSPVLLLCNAAPIVLTLRAYDAAPVCILEPGIAVAPPSNVIRRPFYISVEMGRDTFVSGQLEVLDQEPSPYYVPPPGQVAVDRSTEFAIHCNHKVALLNLYYEIKENINILGISSTYFLLNRLDTKILVSPLAVPIEKENHSILDLTSFKVAIPTKKGSFDGMPLAWFWIHDRWRGTYPSELKTYLCVALPGGYYPAWPPVPIRIGTRPSRRSFGLIDRNKNSVPVVVTQFKHEGRWVLSVSKDPCPQYVVHNRTRVCFAIAEPLHLPDEPSTSFVKAKQECKGINWWCFVYPDSVIHYSSPSYCARYPLPHNAPKKTYVPYIIIAKSREEGDMNWCQPIAVSDGEQLVQLGGGITIKLRIRMHPHSSLIELQEVDHNDISASDIRRRLHGIFTKYSEEDLKMNSIACGLERIGADTQVLDIDSRRIRSPKASEITLIPSFPPVIPPKQVPFPPPPDIAGPSHYDPYGPTSNDPYTYETMRESASALLLYEENASKHVNPEEEDDVKTYDHNIEAASPDSSYVFSSEVDYQEWDEDEVIPTQSDRLRLLLVGASIEMSCAIDIIPLVAVHVDRVAAAISSDSKKTKAVVSVGHVQVDNRQFNTGVYDFAVVASTGSPSSSRDRWPPIWTMFQESKVFAIKQSQAKLVISVQYDKWTVLNKNFWELTEVSLHAGTVSLYIEDAYVKALTELYKMAFPQSSPSDDEHALAEEWSLVNPLRLRSLHIDPLNLTLTLHTAVHMYIAVDQSPLRLSAFKVQDMISTPASLTHLLTVHYLSAAILGAGWVVGGLELLGAPGALAARVSNATGGIRGVASATAAALVRSVSCWAGSLARNLDLLAGDEEHARRAAAARRRPPESFSAGLMTGITNFAINILGAVGGLAHHPFVGVAVGESGSSATALRRGLVGALTKPLSATADLVAFAGHGLLKQTGWDNNPECRPIRWSRQSSSSRGWRRDSVRWVFRLADITPLTGFEVLLQNAQLQLLITHKSIIIADLNTERIIETIDLRYCKLSPYKGPIIQLIVLERRTSKLNDRIIIEDEEEYQVSAAAMARVAHYTGIAKKASISPEYRMLSLLPPPGRSFTLQAALVAALHHNADSHFPLL